MNSRITWLGAVAVFVLISTVLTNLACGDGIPQERIRLLIDSARTLRYAAYSLIGRGEKDAVPALIACLQAKGGPQMSRLVYFVATTRVRFSNSCVGCSTEESEHRLSFKVTGQPMRSGLDPGVVIGAITGAAFGGLGGAAGGALWGSGLKKAHVLAICQVPMCSNCLSLLRCSDPTEELTADKETGMGTREHPYFVW